MPDDQPANLAGDHDDAVALTPLKGTRSLKDLDQAGALIRVLSSQRPGDLEDLWLELRARGPSWRQKADAALQQLPEDIRLLLPAKDRTDRASRGIPGKDQ